jgi:DedD protein
MDQALKQRLIGAAIIVALVVLIVPVFLPGPGERDATQDIDLPEPPRVEREPRLLPINQSPAGMPEPVDNTRQPVDEGIENRLPPAATGQTDSGAERVSDPSQSTQQTPVEPPQQVSPEPGESEPGAPEVPAIEPEPEPTAREAEPEPASTPPETSETASGYAVQVGAFGNENNAISLRDRLREAGYPTFVELYTGGSQAVYRVRVGPAVDRTAAEGLLQRLEAEMDMNGRVVSHP